jgi:hypothetical protein
VGGWVSIATLFLRSLLRLTLSDLACSRDAQRKNEREKHLCGSVCDECGVCCQLSGVELGKDGKNELRSGEREEKK